MNQDREVEVSIRFSRRDKATLQEAVAAPSKADPSTKRWYPFRFKFTSFHLPIYFSWRNDVFLSSFQSSILLHYHRHIWALSSADSQQRTIMCNKTVYYYERSYNVFCMKHEAMPPKWKECSDARKTSHRCKKPDLILGSVVLPHLHLSARWSLTGFVLAEDYHAVSQQRGVESPYLILW